MTVSFLPIGREPITIPPNICQWTTVYFCVILDNLTLLQIICLCVVFIRVLQIEKCQIVSKRSLIFPKKRLWLTTIATGWWNNNWTRWSQILLLVNYLSQVLFFFGKLLICSTLPQLNSRCSTSSYSLKFTTTRKTF